MSAPGPRQEWLNCPEGTVVLQMTASNSAGEGPRGRRIYSEPAAPPGQYSIATNTKTYLGF